MLCCSCCLGEVPFLAHASRLAIQSLLHRKETAHTEGYGTNPTLAARGNFRPGIQPNAQGMKLVVLRYLRLKPAR